jgi:hypothetical protein
MTIRVSEAVRLLDERGQITRHKHRPDPTRLALFLPEVFGPNVPEDLAAFYGEAIASVGEFDAIGPGWSDWSGWGGSAENLSQLMHAGAAPLFWDGCGSLYGLDLTTVDATPAVYFFDHDDCYAQASWAAGSSLGVFLLLLADHDRAYDENWPDRWQLKIDPDIEKCPRAPAIWNAG